MSDRRFSATELTTVVGIDGDDLRTWQDLGLVEPGPDGQFDADAIDRGRLLRFLADRGVAVADVARLAERQSDLFTRWLDYVGRQAGPARSLDEAAHEAELDPALARRMWIAAGRGREREVFDDDVEMMRIAAMALQVGFPADALVQMARVYADALGRVADAEARLFHFYVHERLRAEGLAGEQLAASSTAASEPLMAIIEPTSSTTTARRWSGR